jgi:hypothetical protein
MRVQRLQQPSRLGGHQERPNVAKEACLENCRAGVNAHGVEEKYWLKNVPEAMERQAQPPNDQPAKLRIVPRAFLSD